MTQITIDIPENKIAKHFSKEAWEKIVREAVKSSIKEKMERIQESERFLEIVSKSQATEKDIEELTDMVKEAVWKRHKAYYEKNSSS